MNAMETIMTWLKEGGDARVRYAQGHRVVRLSEVREEMAESVVSGIDDLRPATREDDVRTLLGMVIEGPRDVAPWLRRYEEFFGSPCAVVT